MADETRTVLIEVKVDNKDAVKAMDQFETEVKDVGKATEDTTEKTDEYTSSVEGLNSQVALLPAGLQGAIRSAQGFVKSLRAVKIGIAATGIGALLLVVVALTSAFSNSEEGQNKWAKIMAVFGVVTGNVVDIVADLGDLIIGLFSGDSEAFKSIEAFGKGIWDFFGLPIKNAITAVKTLASVAGALWDGDLDAAANAFSEGMGEVAENVLDAAGAVVNLVEAGEDFIQQQKDEIALAQEVADKRARADKLDRANLVKRSELEQEIAGLRLKSRQEEEFSASERKQALIDAQALEETLLATEKEALELRRDAIVIENSFSRSNKENLDAEAAATAAVNQKVAERLNLQRGTQRELNRVNKEIAREQQIIAKEKATQDAAELKAAQDKIDKVKELQEAEILAAQIRAQEFIENKEANLAAIDEIGFAREVENAKQIEDATLRGDTLVALRQDQLLRELEAEGLASSDRLLLEAQAADDIVAIRQGQAAAEGEIAKAAAADETKWANKGASDKANIVLQGAKQAAGALEAIFGANKATAVANALIDTALGIVNALSFPLPLIVPGIALASSLGAAQVASILAVQPPARPAFGRGGMVTGRLHSQGGVHIEAEHGEYVLNRRSMSNPYLLGLASEINQMGGGVKFAQGGLVGIPEAQSILTNTLFESPEKIQIPILVTEDLDSVQERVAITEAFSTL